MVRPRPLDKFVWVQRTDGSGKQQLVLRSQLPSLHENWERIADPTKKLAAEAEAAEADDANETAAPKKRTAKKQPSTPADSAPEKE
jgi:hypothetical protein